MLNNDTWPEEFQASDDNDDVWDDDGMDEGPEDSD